MIVCTLVFQEEEYDELCQEDRAYWTVWVKHERGKIGFKLTEEGRLMVERKEKADMPRLRQ